MIDSFRQFTVEIVVDWHEINMVQSMRFEPGYREFIKKIEYAHIDVQNDLILGISGRQMIKRSSQHDSGV